jgi:arginyl-tRNA synthetase
MHHGGIEKEIIPVIEKAVNTVLSDLGIKPQSYPDTKPELEIPKDKTHGDISSNIAMRLSKIASRPPIELGTLLKAALDGILASSPVKESVDRVEVKAPGFINFFLSRHYLSGILLEIKRQKRNYGRSAVGGGARMQVEFVSANPTGPLTIAHARQAAIGDSLANILEFLGYRVTREY